MKIRAVMFDMGNTLIRAWTPEVTYQNVLSSLGADRSVAVIKGVLEKVEKEFKDSNYVSRYGKIAYTKYWERYDARVLKLLGISQSQISAKEILARWWDYADCVAYPDTKVSLKRLKQMGVRVGLISNAYEEDISAILDKAGLEKKLFDRIIGVNTIKKGKPHPDIFRHALNELNVEPTEALFIGDNISADYRGAKAVGIHALLIEREDRSTEDASDLERIRSLQEIFKLID